MFGAKSCDRGYRKEESIQRRQEGRLDDRIWVRDWEIETTGCHVGRGGLLSLKLFKLLHCVRRKRGGGGSVFGRSNNRFVGQELAVK